MAVDPGLKKCGLVLADIQAGLVLDGVVASSASVVKVMSDWNMATPFRGIILGNGTSSSYWHKKFIKFAPVQFVEEEGSTFRARTRYWELWPPVNWRRLIPRGLILPPHELDAIAALVFLEDFIDHELSWPGPPTFRTVL